MYYHDISVPDIIDFCILEETVKPYFMQTLRLKVELMGLSQP